MRRMHLRLQHLYLLQRLRHSGGMHRRRSAKQQRAQRFARGAEVVAEALQLRMEVPLAQVPNDRRRAAACVAQP